MVGEDCNHPPDGVALAMFAVTIDDVEMDRVAPGTAETPNRRLAHADQEALRPLETLVSKALPNPVMEPGL